MNFDFYIHPTTKCFVEGVGTIPEEMRDEYFDLEEKGLVSKLTIEEFRVRGSYSYRIEFETDHEVRIVPRIKDESESRN